MDAWTDDGCAGRWISLSSWLAVTHLFDPGRSQRQPIVENYVGRQVPTAMVARNLDRGSGFLRPRLDTAPFPNYFVVEPPIYELGVVLLKRATGLSLGRLGGSSRPWRRPLAAWVFSRSPAARRCGGGLPGRGRRSPSFPSRSAMDAPSSPTPRCWGASSRDWPAGITIDRCVRWYWLVAAWCSLALGFAIKITAAFSADARCCSSWLCARSPRAMRARRLLDAPAGRALVCLGRLPDRLGEGSRASADNRSIWLRALRARRALRMPETLKFVAWFLLVRAFTPVGAVLALSWAVGLRGATRGPDRDGLWLALGHLRGSRCHGVSARKNCITNITGSCWRRSLPWESAAAWRWLRRNSRAAPRSLSAGTLFGLSWIQVRSTWRTPAEWSGLEPAASAVASDGSADAWVVAPEALLFQADRRGCRMEWTTAAATERPDEWGRRTTRSTARSN